MKTYKLVLKLKVVDDMISQINVVDLRELIEDNFRSEGGDDSDE